MSSDGGEWHALLERLGFQGGLAVSQMKGLRPGWDGCFAQQVPRFSFPSARILSNRVTFQLLLIIPSFFTSGGLFLVRALPYSPPVFARPVTLVLVSQSNT
mgnify:CR=1 FL=1